MKMLKLELLGGRYYPGSDSNIVFKGKHISHFTNRQGIASLELKTGDVFLAPEHGKHVERFPNKFRNHGVEEVDIAKTMPGASLAPATNPKTETAPENKTSKKANADDPFPFATEAGLKVTAKKIKGKGERYFVYDPEVSEEEPLNEKSLAVDEVEAFVKAHLAK